MTSGKTSLGPELKLWKASHECFLAASIQLDELATHAAQYSLELRKLTEKGARLRKKKALVDFLQALSEAGISHKRNAIPPSERTVHSWFSQVSNIHMNVSSQISACSPIQPLLRMS